MYDNTQMKIIEATMNLVMEKGYAGMTTKDIASLAGVNECTIFRKFKGKKDIILEAMTLPEWNPQLKESDFDYTGEVEKDLVSFAHVYLKKVTPHMVKVSLGLRSPELYEDTKDGIMEIPNTMMQVLLKYFKEMYVNGKISCQDAKGMAMQFLSMIFGYVFFQASFGEKLSDIMEQEYVENSVHRFLKGIC